MLYLTLRQYEYVCAIAQAGSLSAASNALNVSQPALSAALTRIEAHLGQTLFLRRRGAALALTPQGRDFAFRARALLDQAAGLETPGADPTGPQRLVLACFTDLAPFLLAPALKLLRDALPGLQISFRTAAFAPLTEALTSGEADLALTYDLGLDAGFQRVELARLTPHVLTPPDHPLAHSAEVTLEDVARHPLILSQEGLSVQHMLGLFRRRGLAPVVAHRAGSLELLRSLAANGEGVGLAYSLPPGARSYDGLALASTAIAGTDAQEPVILACHGAAALGPVAEAARTVLAEHLRFGSA